MIDEDEFETELRAALHRSAQRCQFEVPPWPPFGPPSSRPARVPVTLAAVAAGGLLVAGLAITSYVRDTPAESGDPFGATAVPASDAVGSTPDPAPSTAVLRLVEPSPDAAGLTISEPRATSVRRPVLTYWFGALATPSGAPIAIEADPFPAAPPNSSEREIESGGGTTYIRDTPDEVTARIVLDCGSVTLTFEPEVFRTDGDQLLRSISLLEGGGISIRVPTDWISFGGGYASPAVARTLTLEDNGTTVEIELVQQFSTAPGALIYSGAIATTTRDGRHFLILSDSTTSSIVTSVADDAVMLSGPLPPGRLVEIASSLTAGPEYTPPTSIVLPGDPSMPNASCPVALSSSD